MSAAHIVDLREQYNAIVERLVDVLAAASRLTDVEITVTAEMREIDARIGEDEEGDFEDRRGLAEVEKLFSSRLLSVLDYHNNDSDHSDNIQFMLRFIATMGNEYEPVVCSGTPVLTGLTVIEVGKIIGYYRRTINGINTKLRDAHTNWCSLDQIRRPMPLYLKSSLLGMFGASDHPFPDSYVEADFASTLYKEGAHRIEWLRWGRNQQMVDRRVDLRPALMSTKYLAPIVGVEKAKQIVADFTIIGDRSRPRPGEPPALDFFGSHRTNAIEIV